MQSFTICIYHQL